MSQDTSVLSSVMCHVTKLSMLQGFLTASLHCVKEETQKNTASLPHYWPRLVQPRPKLYISSTIKIWLTYAPPQEMRFLCSNMINHGLNHGLLSLPYTLCCVKINSNLNQKFRIIISARNQPIFQLPKCAGPSRFFLVFIVCTWDI